VIKDFSDSSHQPLTWKQHLENERQEELRQQEEAARPLREAEAALNQTHKKLFELEKGEIEAGRPDPAWTWPQSADGLNMSVDAAREFAKRESEAFVAANPGYYPCKKNFATIVNYLCVQGVAIPTRDCFAQAAERLQHFGLLEERPAEPKPESAPVVEPQTEPQAQQEDLVDGFDPVTGEPRRFNRAEIWKMSSSDLKKAFKMWTHQDGTDRRAKFTRGRYV
jgi:hypothetical protein